MKLLVTGSAGHLGEALVRTLIEAGHEVAGLDILASPSTTHQGSVVDRSSVRECMAGVDAVLHTATLHKPHVATHDRQKFVDTNVTGTLNLLEEAVAARVGAFVFTSTTSVFGDALVPPPGEPAAWITERVAPVPKNIYGVTKAAAENLCQLFHRNQRLPCIVLRTSRFFPEEDDNRATRAAFADDNVTVNEFSFRRVDIEDVVSAHLRSLERAADIGFGRYIISATTPFTPDDLGELRADAPSVLKRRVPDYERTYSRWGWQMVSSVDRVYVNAAAIRDLGWTPTHDFRSVLRRLETTGDLRSPMARLIGKKGYHDQVFEDGPFPVA
ncbi:MAG: NAD-dependent epimerase/dehydratase family protein [Geminicoccaceae bacterium]